jgi:hypothetical protein
MRLDPLGPVSLLKADELRSVPESNLVSTTQALA